MRIRHDAKSPRIDPEAWIAPNAVVCGDVAVGPGCRIMHGAQLIAEGGSIELGRECIVMQNAVLRGSARHSLKIGNHCLVGPNAHVVGCRIDDEVFVATGAAIFHAARVERECEVRINGVVHVRSRLEAGATVPIGWIAVGDPAQIFPPGEHDRIWALQEPMNFPATVYGYDRRQATMRNITGRLSRALGQHAGDEVERD
jgi:carbonic anhydrase/acetyltransferase-like protein (isoleucine patch superfamily)